MTKKHRADVNRRKDGSVFRFYKDNTAVVSYLTATCPGHFLKIFHIVKAGLGILIAEGIGH